MSNSPHYARPSPSNPYPDEFQAISHFTPSPRPPSPDHPHVSHRERDPRYPLSGRSRGASISTIADDHESHPGASEDEGSIISTDRPRRTSVKSKEKPRPIISSGDLNLPPKLSSIPSPVVLGDPSIRDNTSRVPTPLSASTPKWSAQFAASSSQSGRNRSGSVGMAGSSSRLRSVSPNVNSGVRDSHNQTVYSALANETDVPGSDAGAWTHDALSTPLSFVSARLIPVLLCCKTSVGDIMLRLLTARLCGRCHHRRRGRYGLWQVGSYRKRPEGLWSVGTSRSRRRITVSQDV